MKRHARGNDVPAAFMRGSFLKHLIPVTMASMLILFGCPAPTTGSAQPVDAIGAVNFNIAYQTIEGFGGSGAYETYDLTTHTQKEAIYDLLFRDLGLDIFRIKNTYLHVDDDTLAPDTNLDACGELVAEGIARNSNLKIELVPWSPAAGLKNTGKIKGGGTLKKTGGVYDYAAYADWWADSLTDAVDGWASIGVAPDYISLQNEPDMRTDYESCLFSPDESTEYAGYRQAFDAVHDAIALRVPGQLAVMPKLIGSETVGYGSGPLWQYAARGAKDYIDKLTAAGESNMYGYSFHPYGDGGGTAGYDNPDNHLAAMRIFAADSRYNDKPLFMTEYVRLNQTPTFDHAVKLAWHIHNFLMEMKASAYFHWTLFRGYGTGGMINFTGTTPPSTYEIRDLYYFFKHYAFFTNPGWRVIFASTTTDNLRVTAFRSPTAVTPAELVVVILNKSTTPVNLTLHVDNFLAAISEAYRSSAAEHWVNAGTFTPGDEVAAPALSITTIRLIAP